MKLKLIERAWLSYLARVVPKNAGPEQVKGSRQAFYSGATILFSILTSEQFFDKGETETVDDLAKMQMIQDEVDTFGAEIDLAVLNIRKH